MKMWTSRKITSAAPWFHPSSDAVDGDKDILMNAEETDNGLSWNNVEECATLNNDRKLGSKRRTWSRRLYLPTGARNHASSSLM